MKQLLFVAAILLFVAGVTDFALAEPFAPRVGIPGEMLQEGHDQYLNAVTAQKSQIPDQEDVGFPAYPGAKILFTQMNNRSYEDGKEINLPKRIFLGTPDSVEQVVAFYRENLEEYRYGEFFGTPTFYKKEGEFKPMEDMITPRVVIAPEFRTRDLMPESKTTIDIYYD
ncbi:hypothetical protein [Desulfopila inferna]|uniref:hypothetical protein n=1 Tax=Desulfopila inferna TaxID=468528 RepID=UPI00196246FF|nr:hypothetical protein [Desulfopila inferna]MBM9606644.1 hypothetical protein [Desulfopila inferna]